MVAAALQVRLRAAGRIEASITQRAAISGVAVVCTENSILIDYVTGSPNVSGDDRSVMLLPDPVRLAVQVEEPT